MVLIGATARLLRGSRSSAHTRIRGTDAGRAGAGRRQTSDAVDQSSGVGEHGLLVVGDAVGEAVVQAAQ